MQRWVSVLAVFAIVTGAGGALAQTSAPSSTASDAPSDKALGHFKRGLELHEEQDYSGALVEFRRAYDLSPTYKVLFNIGQECYQLADYACALRSFQTYLSEGGTIISPERRSEVQRDIEKLKTRVGRLDIGTNVPGVDVSVDDVYVGKTPLLEPIMVSAGKRRIQATKEGRVPVTRIVDLGGTDTKKVNLELVDATVRTVSIVRREEKPSKFTTLSWVGIGAAAALGAGAAVTGGLALSASTDLEKSRFAEPGPDGATESKQSDVRALALTSDILLGAAVVTLGTTLVLTLIRDPKPVVVTPEGEGQKSARRPDPASGVRVQLGVAGSRLVLGGSF